MRKWMPFIILVVIAILCTLVTVMLGLWAYLAVTGLDLLVMARKDAPQAFAISAAVSSAVWLASVIILFITKPYRKTKRLGSCG